MTTVVGRRAQRKAETRGALVRAGRTLLAERRTAVSIREITELAGVGFGSFFNYFESKEALFEAAAVDSLTTYGTALKATGGFIEDPAESVAVGLRLGGRLQRLLPTHFKVLLGGGMLLALHGDGLHDVFQARLAAGNELGQFDAPDLQRSALAISGAMLGFIQLLDMRPELDAAAESDEFTRRTLLTLGVPAAEAARLVALPLPEIPAWVGEEPVGA